jgi:predicted dithiol-disulfide oxidoreductase (DUF899 family)
MQPRIVSRAEWNEEGQRHLEREKELTHLRDAISRERRALPWVRIEKDYVFEGPNGPESLADLFDGRNQLIVYHFMFGPDWAQGCPSCSFLSDHFDPALIHLEHRDVTLRVVSRAPIERIEAFRKRMGWKFHWVSSNANEFNFDFNVSVPRERAWEIADGYVEEGHGLSVFIRGEDGAIYQTYSSFSRGCDLLIGTYNFLDLVPKGRDEDGLAFPMAWMRHHDRYDNYEFNPKDNYPMPKRVGCCS